MSGTSAVRVAIVEDDLATREGLAVLIEGTPGYACVGRFESVEAAVSGMKTRAADVLLLDIHLPGMSGAEGVRLFHANWPALQIVMLTIFNEQEKVFESICNGACGYLLKKTPPAKLIEAIREAHEGGAPMSPEIARKVVALFRHTMSGDTVDEALTPQEVRLLALLADGYSYESAAHQLNISINTVRNYIRSIYDKLHVHSKSEAVSKALRNRIIH